MNQSNQKIRDLNAAFISETGLFWVSQAQKHWESYSWASEVTFKLREGKADMWTDFQVVVVSVQ